MHVANLSALSGPAMASHHTGDTVFVETLRSRFVLDKASTTPIDSITVVANTSGGRWLRLPVAHPSWLRQGTWFIDPDHGDDERDGTTQGKAIRTHAELTRRWGTEFATVLGSPTAGPRVITVTLLHDLPASDPIDLKVTLGPGTLLAYMGTATTIGQGTLEVVTKKVRTKNTPWTVRDASSAAGLQGGVGQRVRITGGSHPGQFAWIATTPVNGVVRMSSFSNPTMPAGPSGDPATLRDVTLPTDVADVVEGGTTEIGGKLDGPYVVESLTQVRVQSIQVDGPLGGTSDTAPVIAFVNIHFHHLGPESDDPKKRKDQIQGGVRGVKAVFKGCSWDGTLALSSDIIRHWYLNCRFYHLGLNRVGAFFRGGITLGEISYRGGIAAFDDDFMCQGGAGFRIQSSGILFGRVCAFDSEQAGFHLGMFSAWPSTASCFSFAEGSKGHLLWGAGNKKGGVSVGGGSVLSYESTVPTVTGLTPGVDDFVLAGSPVGRAFDESLGLPTSARANSWANLSAPIASGGFGWNAHNFERNAHVVRI